MIIDFYVFCMGLGLAGLLLMLLMGFGHHADASQGHADFHGGGHFHLGHHDAGGHGHLDGAAHDGGSAHHELGGHAGSLTQTVLAYLAPRVWFSLLFGFGAAGCLLGRWITGPVLAVLAIAAAWAFERGLVRPVWNFMLRFASAPARTLETAVFEEAVAATNFDAQGAGLVSVTLDGQVHQMLGTLQAGPEPIARVHAGEHLIIVGVNARRNTCTVARRSIRPESLS